MRQTKKITLSALLVALGIVFMTLGVVIGTIDLTVAMLTSLLMAFVYIEIGSPYTYFTWLATSILSAIFFFTSPIWIEYFLLFGFYPILKGYIEKIPFKPLWLLIKIIYFNLSFAAIIWLSGALIGVDMLESELALNIVLFALANISLVLYDSLLTVGVRFYFAKLRKRFERLIK